MIGSFLSHLEYKSDGIDRIMLKEMDNVLLLNDIVKECYYSNAGS